MSEDDRRVFLPFALLLMGIVVVLCGIAMQLGRIVTALERMDESRVSAPK